MRLVRGLGGALLWILASLLGLVAVLLCVTVVLLPLGIVLLREVRRMWTTAVRLMLPRGVAHPVKEMGRKGRKQGSAMRDEAGSASKRARKKARSVSKRTGKATRRQRRKLAA